MPPLSSTLDFSAPNTIDTTAPSQTYEIAKTYTRWTARVILLRHALPHSYRVKVYLGDPPVAPDTKWAEEAFMGAHGVLLYSNMVVPEGAKQLLTRGHVPLNRGLDRNLGLGRSIAEVEAYLGDHLYWRVTNAGDDEIPLDDRRLSSLSVSACSSIVTLYNGPDGPGASATEALENTNVSTRIYARHGGGSQKKSEEAAGTCRRL